MLKYILLIIFLIFIVNYIINYYKSFGKIQIYHHNPKLIQDITLLHKTYYPSIVYSNTLNILNYNLFNKTIHYDFISEKVQTKSNTYIKWINLKENYNKNKPIIIILYGATGILYIYKNDFIYKCIQNDWIICNIVLQSQFIDKKIVTSSSTENILTYANLEDIKIAIETIKFKYPDNPIFLYGISLGALLTLNLIQIYPNIPLTGVIAISSPWDLKKTFTHWKHNLNFIEKLYSDKRYTNYIKSYMKNRNNIIKQNMDYNDAFELLEKNPHIFDNISKDNVELIKIKTLIIHSIDDNITPIQFVPLDKLKQNNNIITCIIPFGGHVHFLDLYYNFYVDNICIEYIKKYFNHLHQ
jgi:predicted alpha/beta-fold hydrolase